MRAKRACKGCGLPTAGTFCGNCNRARMAASVLAYRYTRTHVCTHADGTRTIESGAECDGGCA